jgi:glycosyltransferase involved in cell wall biosynthesis
MPKVSILIPTHNRAEVIRDAVDSCLAQTERDIEVVVYDDGSDDMDGKKEKKGSIILLSKPTPEIMKKFKDPRVKYVQCKENHGAAYSRNRLMEMATGEYSMWLDSDDVSNIYRVEMCLKAIEKYQRPYVRTATTTFSSSPGDTWKNPPLLVYRGGVSFATIMFPTCNAIEFDTSYLHCCEDMDWELRYAAQYGHSVYIPMTLYGIGRCAQDRLTMRYKDERKQAAYAKDKTKYGKKATLIVQRMEAAGKTKMPKTVPWDFVEEYMGQFYRKRYKRVAK